VPDQTKQSPLRVPYYATDAVARHSIEGRVVALKCYKHAGPPVTIALTPEIARKAIGGYRMS